VVVPRYLELENKKEVIVLISFCTFWKIYGIKLKLLLGILILF